MQPNEDIFMPHLYSKPDEEFSVLHIWKESLCKKLNFITSLKPQLQQGKGAGLLTAQLYFALQQSV